MSIFRINPYIGYNNIKYNISQEDVKKIDGVASKIEINNIMMKVYEYRDASIKLTFVEDNFVEVWIPQKPADNQVFLVDFMELDLFDVNTVEILKSKYEFEESKDKRKILFEELGLCLWGFGEKKTKEGKIVMAFAKNRLSWYKSFMNA